MLFITKNLESSRFGFRVSNRCFNEDYRRLNENAVNTRDEFLEFAGDLILNF